MHWRAKGGVGEFNYRFVYDFAVDQKLPVKQPCSFTLKAWDKDPLTFKSDFLGQREVDLSHMVADAMLQLRDQQKHDEEIKVLLQAGRIDEMLLEVQKYRAERQRKRAEAVAAGVQRAKERIEKGRNAKRQPDEDDEKQDDEPNSILGGCVRWVRDCFSQSQMAVAQVAPHGGSAEDRAQKYKWDHARQWMLRDIEGTYSGTAWVSVELVHESVSKNQPVGKGREAPNEYPVLDEPERERLSLTHPLGALRYFVGPARLKIARNVVTILVILGLAWVALSTFLNTFIRNIVIHDVLAPLTATCPDGFAVASAVHDSFCGGDAEFKPQMEYWLNCLGPFATLQGHDTSRVPVDDALCRRVVPEEGGVQFRFNWGLCENATKLCNPGLQRQLDTMQTMTRERQQAVFDHHCEYGGRYYNLVIYSPDCETKQFRGARSCENEPCRSCVSVADGVCPPGPDSWFVSKLIWRVLIPALCLYAALLAVKNIVTSRALCGYHGPCLEMPACRYLSSVRRACTRRAHCKNVHGRRIKKLVTWAIVLFGVLYATMLCDAC